MISHEANILLALMILLMLGKSWFVHYKVKDGIARLMFLWGCGMLFFFVLIRMTSYILLEFGIIDGAIMNRIFTYNVWLIYALVVGQFYLQNKE